MLAHYGLCSDLTHSEFVMAVKDWNANMQLAIIPTPLRSRLINYYVELHDVTKGDIKLLKAVVLVQEQASVKEDRNLTHF